MTWSLVNGQDSYPNITGSSPQSRTITAGTTGNIFICTIVVAAGSPTPTGLSGGGIGTWNNVINALTGNSTTPSSMSCWWGVLDGSANPTALSISFSGSLSGANLSVSVYQFHSSTGSLVGSPPTLDTSGTFNQTVSGATVNWPSLATAGSGELYFGYAQTLVGTITTGTTSGITYLAPGDAICHDVNTSGSPIAPTRAISPNDTPFGYGLLLIEPAGAAPASIPSYIPQYSDNQRNVGPMARRRRRVHLIQSQSPVTWTQAPTDAAGTTDSSTLTVAQAPVDSAGSTDSAAIGPAPTDTAGATDSAALTVAQAPVDTAGTTDSTAFTVAQAPTDTAGSTDSAALTVAQTPTDSAGSTDSAIVSRVTTLTQADDSGSTDSNALTVTQAPVDTAGSTDSTTLNVAQAPTDSAGSTDSAAIGPAPTDTAGTTDSSALVVAQAPADTAGSTDSKVLSVAQAPVDSAGSADADSLSLAQVQVDDAGSTDSAAVLKTSTLTFTDDSGSTDSATPLKTSALAFTDDAGSTDSVSIVSPGSNVTHPRRIVIAAEQRMGMVAPESRRIVQGADIRLDMVAPESRKIQVPAVARVYTMSGVDGGS